MKKTIIEDIHFEWHAESYEPLHVFVDFADGSSKRIARILPEKRPLFLEEDENLFDQKEYEEWYNSALDDAHRQGYILSGEAQ